MTSSEKSLATENHAFFLYLMAKSVISDSLKPKPTNTGKFVPAASIKSLMAESELRTATSGATNFLKKRTNGLIRGMEVIEMGAPLIVPVGGATLGRTFNVLGDSIYNLGPLDTKLSIFKIRIKAVELLAPYRR
ncbi:hypothetical protein RJ639_033755 [Escallonia herrerae]|uniref:H(+)-transporting two-sector ATPase n=1 Tax=Escallonia herrerae TaxID=1293975 RepID=A0AA89B9N6_9ASTE|nr:hypothetical protein RJ639_033755 [Escallonia herrerae]